jgi:hypothetical protein
MNVLKKSRFFISALMIFGTLLMSSCSTVKSSEKAYLNDGEMTLALRNSRLIFNYTEKAHQALLEAKVAAAVVVINSKEIRC